MPEPGYTNYQERVVQAAEAALKREGSVGLLELFMEMRFLHPGHFDGWRKGSEFYPTLFPWIQVGPAKLERAIDHFHEWARARGLRVIEANYSRRGGDGVEPLRITDDGDVKIEAMFRKHYAPAELPAKKAARLTEKLSKPPDLVVFELVSKEAKCAECGIEMAKGDFLTMEKGQPHCLTCADLDELVFLPSGDTALTRRSRKHSPLSAVVVRFSRARRRYERQGLLVSEAALAKAQEECAADAPERAAARAVASISRQGEDREFVEALAKAILRKYPGCPAGEAQEIAEHAGQRHSGRVGRSAAGRALEASAVDLAVIAHIRHVHTNYDELLMKGTDRLDARGLVRGAIDLVLAKWSAV